MRIAIIGAGVAGMTTAWALARAGHELTVFEQSSGVAEQTSFLGLGLMGPASTALFELTEPQWPAAPLAGWALQRPWLWRARAQRWLAQKRRNTASPQRPAQQALRVQLALESVQQVEASAQAIRLDLDTQMGALVLWRPPHAPDALAADGDRLKALGLTGRLLNAEATRKSEPGLSEDVALEAAWALDNDRAINGRQWLLGLKGELARQGVRFAFRHDVVRIDGGQPVRLSVRTSATAPPQELPFDRVVVAHGAAAGPQGLRPSRLLALDHVMISAPLRESLYAPNAVVIDGARRLCMVRSGQRIKASSMAPLWPQASDARALKQLFLALNEWFPGAAQLQGPSACVQTWRGRCTYTPDGLPLAGPTALQGVWMNTGYGGMGWSLAPAVGADLADRMAGRPPRYDPDALSPQRWA